MGDIVQIYDDYKDRADFLTVYVREAHPTDEWQMKSMLCPAENAGAARDYRE
ncbi:MAG: hypothetical protein DMG49_05195 [Acidobacteria bacterium]|nr:MAG: hypothetical protein DMG49_05195 [Acidobacteriota bacterium]